MGRGRDPAHENAETGSHAVQAVDNPAQRSRVAGGRISRDGGGLVDRVTARPPARQRHRGGLISENRISRHLDAIICVKSGNTRALGSANFTSSGGYVAIYAVGAGAVLVLLGDEGLDITRLHRESRSVVDNLEKLLALGQRAAADRGVQDLRGVRDRDVLAALGQGGGDLQRAARVGRDEQRRPGGLHRFGLAGA